jgi:DNA (cytosine-5)-methyltransferase 1
MGFPDSFRIPVSDTRAYKQFGNSVVVDVMRHAAQLMKAGIMAEGAGVKAKAAPRRRVRVSA